MKFQKIIYVFALASFTLLACKTESKKTPVVNKAQATPNPKKMAFNISGMTCEIGCAKTIQSKLSKKEGITKATVIFNDSIGYVEYDANAISAEDISSFVDGIAGGDLYKVKNAKEVTSIEELTK